MAVDMQTLASFHRQRLGVVFMLLVSGVTLALGLTQPVFLVEKFIFWESHYSVLTGVIGLFEDGEYILAFILFFFSIVFPVVKLLVLTIIWRAKMSHEQRFKLLRILQKLGKWSMLDVFAVAILVVAGKLGALADVHPLIGIYLFATGILTSMLTTIWIQKLALRAARGGGEARQMPAAT